MGLFEEKILFWLFRIITLLFWERGQLRRLDNENLTNSKDSKLECKIKWDKSEQNPIVKIHLAIFGITFTSFMDH